MTNKSPLVPLTDMRDAIRRIERYTKGKTGTDFAKDELVRDAVERCIEVISEASRRIPAPLKAKHSTIPWPRIAGIGNVLRHDYNEIAPPLIWDVVTDHLPALKRAILAMIRETKKSSK